MKRATPGRRLIAAVVAVILGGVLLGGLDLAATPGSATASASPLAIALTPTIEPVPAPARSAGPNPAPDPAAVVGPLSSSLGLTVAAAAGLPNFRHIYVIVLENREYGSIVGSSNAPYINSLIARYGLATNYRAVTHPSQPNYIALFSGSTQGVTDNKVHRLARRNLADQLAAHRISWQVFAQNVPLGCYTGATASGGSDGSGTYARKHEPAISFTSITRRPSRCAKIRDFSHFSPSIARFELIVPNMCNSMHDCSTAQGDAWLSSFVPKILKSPAMKGSALFLTWDEGSSNLGGGGRIATVVVGPTVKRAYRSAAPHTHYSLLRTIENAWGLGCLNHSCAANDLDEFFR